MNIETTETVTRDAKTMKVHIKVCDEFEGDLIDASGSKICRYEGYVPEFFPGDHYGDYLILDIDIETGQITNWVKPEATEVAEFVEQARRAA